MDEQIRILQDKVNQITLSTVKSENCIVSSSGSFLHGYKLNSPLVYYGSVPCLIIIILLIYKPLFVMEDISIDGKFPEKRLSYKKLLIATVIGTTLIAIIIFIYFYRTNRTH